MDNLTAPISFSPDERSRYARHLLLPEVGEAGQRKLKAARVLVVGLGGLGSPVALYLAAAGVGTLGLVDADIVDASNMQRQILYGTDNINTPKAEAAAKHLQAMNPHVAYIVHPQKFSIENAEALLKDYDIVIDGTDTFAAHYLINDACVLFGKPLVYGSVSRFAGQVGAVLPRISACYRCLYPAPPPPDFIPSCAEAGVLCVVPGLVGMAQANEAVKLILGIGEPLTDRVLLIDALKPDFKIIALARSPSCRACGEHPLTTLTETAAACAVPPDLPKVAEITAEELKQELASATPPFILDVRNENEFAESRIAGSTLIPLPVLPQRFAELDPARDTVVHCHSGIRSAKAIAFLQSQGFTHLRNLKGGIVAFQQSA